MPPLEAITLLDSVDKNFDRQSVLEDIEMLDVDQIIGNHNNLIKHLKNKNTF